MDGTIFKKYNKLFPRNRLNSSKLYRRCDWVYLQNTSCDIFLWGPRRLRRGLAARQHISMTLSKRVYPRLSPFTILLTPYKGLWPNFYTCHYYFWTKSFRTQTNICKKAEALYSRKENALATIVTSQILSWHIKRSDALANARLQMCIFRIRARQLSRDNVWRRALSRF